MRDSALWKTPEGIAARWTRMGEGTMGMEDYRIYIQKCPGKAVSLEVIVSAQPRMFNYANPDAWALYRNQPAWEFARFWRWPRRETLAGAAARSVEHSGGTQPGQRRIEHPLDAGVPPKL